MPDTGTAYQPTVCDQALAQAGTGQGPYGSYRLVRAPANGGSGSQVVVGTAGADRLSGGSGDDVLCGLGGDDFLDGGSGNDHIDGGAGDDTLQGGSDDDVLDGGPGLDRVFGWQRQRHDQERRDHRWRLRRQPVRRPSYGHQPQPGVRCRAARS